MKLPLGSHGQAIFDYDLDGDDDFITNGFNHTDPKEATQSCGTVDGVFFKIMDLTTLN